MRQSNTKVTFIILPIALLFAGCGEENADKESSVNNAISQVSIPIDPADSAKKIADAFLSQAGIKDRASALKFVKEEGNALEILDKTLQSDKEIVLAAVNQTGMALAFASAGLQQDKDVVMAAVKNRGDALRFADESLQKYLVDEGSITIDGISLTIAELDNSKVGISIIPHTWQNTAIQFKKVGDKINIETDVLAKYIEKLLTKNGNGKTTSITENWLKELGY